MHLGYAHCTESIDEMVLSIHASKCLCIHAAIVSMQFMLLYCIYSSIYFIHFDSFVIVDKFMRAEKKKLASIQKLKNWMHAWNAKATTHVRKTRANDHVSIEIDPLCIPNSEWKLAWHRIQNSIFQLELALQTNKHAKNNHAINCAL